MTKSIRPREFGWVYGGAIAALTLALIEMGCGTTTAFDVRAANRERLNQLSIGLTKHEAFAIMGTYTTTVCHSNPITCLLIPASRSKVTNPHRTETPRAKEGTLVEIVYYETETKKRDGATTDDELTPLVFENGRLVGWGWSFLEQNIERYEIRIR